MAGLHIIEALHAALPPSPAVGELFLRLQHRLGDAAIGAAAAEIAAHALADALGIVAGLALRDQADGAHDLARRAEAALEAVMRDEGGLHRMQRRPAPAPSMVRMSAPSWLTASARQELIRRPSTSTVQAPHWPRSQPFLVPVRSRRSRRRSSRVTRGSSELDRPASRRSR